MGKVDRLRNRVDNFAELFQALGTVRAKTTDLSAAVHKACPYMVTVGSILSEDLLPLPLFQSTEGILFIYGSVADTRIDKYSNKSTILYVQ